MLEVQHLVVNYRDKRVVENISFCLELGQIVGIIGPNGAGKTSLIQAILGLIPVTQGNVTFCALPLSQQLKTIAYVPQSKQIDWDYPITVKNVVMMARICHTGFFRSPSRYSKAMVRFALERVEMWDYRDHSIGALSGGQQQRVFLAQALAQEADLFVLDEPFISVDKVTEIILFEIFRELKSQGKLLLVVGHELRETAREYDQFLLMNKKLIAQGSYSKVITPKNLHLAYGNAINLLNLDANELNHDSFII